MTEAPNDKANDRSAPEEPTTAPAHTGPKQLRDALKKANEKNRQKDERIAELEEELYVHKLADACRKARIPREFFDVALRRRLEPTVEAAQAFLAEMREETNLATTALGASAPF